MKCDNVIAFTGKKGKRLVVISTWYNTFTYPEGMEFKDQQVCGGDISCTVKLEYEPYMGGCSERVDVDWTCSRCKTMAIEFPRDADLRSIANF